MAGPQFGQRDCLQSFSETARIMLGGSKLTKEGAGQKRASEGISKESTSPSSLSLSRHLIHLTFSSHPPNTHHTAMRVLISILPFVITLGAFFAAAAPVSMPSSGGLQNARAPATQDATVTAETVRAPLIGAVLNLLPTLQVSRAAWRPLAAANVLTVDSLRFDRPAVVSRVLGNARAAMLIEAVTLNETISPTAATTATTRELAPILPIALRIIQTADL